MEEMNLDEMRQQMAILKNKIVKQQVVSDRLLRTVMKTRMDVIATQEVKQILAGLLALIIYIAGYAFDLCGFSLAHTIATCIMLIVCVGFTVKYHYPLHRIDLMNDDIATVAKKVHKLRKQYKYWLHYVTPTLLLPWLFWTCREYVNAYGITDVNPVYIVSPMIIAAGVGFTIGYRIHRKVVDSAAEILKQIEE